MRAPGLGFTLALGMAAMLVAGAVQAAGADARARTQCAACHGADGRGVSDDFPVLAGQHAGYLAQALNDYQRGVRKNAIMQAQVAGLSADEIAALAAYFSSLPGPLRVRR